MMNILLRPFLRKTYENNRIERIWKIAQVDFKRRYYNDILGLLWALVNPLSQIAIYYFVFTRIFQRNRENYALYIFCGLILWIAFSEATRTGSTIIKRKKYLIENIQFDWLDLFYSHMISILLGLSFNITAYFFIAYFTGVSLGLNFHLFPVVLLIWYFISISTAMILSLIRPIFDDIVHVWNILLMIGFWTSGVFFDGSFFYDNYTWFMYANPFIGIILNTRACLLENHAFHVELLWVNIGYAILLFSIALFLFRRNVHRVIEKI